MFAFKSMNIEDVKSIIKWIYPQPYDFYNMGDEEGITDELLDGSYLAGYMGDELVGFICYGKNATVPCEGSAKFYAQAEYIDFGLGLKPDLTGKGIGAEFVTQGLKFCPHGYKGIRLAVADFNKRAQKVYNGVGFKEIGVFTNDKGQIFVVMVKEIFQLN